MPSQYTNSRDELLQLFPDNNQQLIEAKDIRAFVNAIYDEAVIQYEDVIDNLVTIDIGKPLSAHQGYILNISKEDKIGDPSIDGQVLHSNADGTRYWADTIRKIEDLDNVDDSVPNHDDFLVYDGNINKYKPIPITVFNAYEEKGGRVWDSKKDYLKGDIVSDKEQLYIAKLDNTNNQPSLTPGTWELIKDINSLTDLEDVNLVYGTVNDGDYLKANAAGIFSNSNFTQDVIQIIENKIIPGVGISIIKENLNLKISLDAELNELNNVSVTNPKHLDTLIYNTNTQEWENADILNYLDKGGQEWEPGHFYEKGAIVTRLDQIFVAMYPNIDEDPINSGNWRIVSLQTQPDVNIKDLENGDVLLYDELAKQFVNTGTTFIGGKIEHQYKIPRLNQNGKLDSNMIEVTMFHRIDSWDPSWGDEYPDTTGHTPGAFWDIIFYNPGVNDYTFSTGDLVGQTVKAGDFIIWGLGGWTIMPAVMDPLDYYRRDGQLPLTADFQAGGYRLKEVAPGFELNDGVNFNQLQTKEDNLGVPSVNDYVLASDVNGNRYWVENTGGIQEVLWGDINGDIINQTDLIQEFDKKADIINVFDKTEYLDVSDGNAGKPIITTANGKIHNSFINIESLYYVETFTPTSSQEYPDTTNETPGAFWIVQGLSIPYTFMTGDLVGETVNNGDYMIWGSNGWGVLETNIDPNLYYLLDGSKAITGPFAGGNQQIKNIASGTDDSDAINLFQHNQHVNDINNPHNVNKAQIGLDKVENIAPSDMPVSDPVQSELDSKENWLNTPPADGMVLSSKIDGTREWIHVNTNIQWGDITGVLSNQTDLQQELDNRVRKTGDTINGDLIVTGKTTTNELLIKTDTYSSTASITFDNVTVGNDTQILWDSSLSDFRVLMNNGFSYKLLHEGNVDLNDYLKKSGDTMEGPLVLDSLTPVSALEASPKGYVDTEIQNAVSDMMNKSVYDTNDNGIVDLSEDSEKLGGELPDYYASQTDVDNKVSKTGDTMTGDLEIQANLISDHADIKKIKVGLNPALGNDSRIEYTDTNYQNSNPAIFWNSDTQKFMIDEVLGKNYQIWHSGNFNPGTINRTVRKTFIGDGVTTTYPIPEGYTPWNANVFYNGVRIFEPEDVDISSGTEIVFTQAPENGDRIDFEGFKNGLLGDHPSV